MAIPYHNYNASFLILRHSFKKSLLIMKQYMIIRNYGKMLFSYVLQTYVLYVPHLTLMRFFRGYTAFYIRQYLIPIAISCHSLTACLSSQGSFAGFSRCYAISWGVKQPPRRNVKYMTECFSTYTYTYIYECAYLGPRLQ